MGQAEARRVRQAACRHLLEQKARVSVWGGAGRGGRAAVWQGVTSLWPVRASADRLPWLRVEPGRVRFMPCPAAGRGPENEAPQSSPGETPFLSAWPGLTSRGFSLRDADWPVRSPLWHVRASLVLPVRYIPLARAGLARALRQEETTTMTKIELIAKFWESITASEELQGVRHSRVRPMFARRLAPRPPPSTPSGKS